MKGPDYRTVYRDCTLFYKYVDGDGLKVHTNRGPDLLLSHFPEIKICNNARKELNNL